MNKHVKSLLEEARKLPDAQRAELAGELLASLAATSPELDRLWSEEAEKRLDDYRQGRIDAVDASSVMAALRRRTR